MSVTLTSPLYLCPLQLKCAILYHKCGEELSQEGGVRGMWSTTTRPSKRKE